MSLQEESLSIVFFFNYGLLKLLFNSALHRNKKEVRQKDQIQTCIHIAVPLRLNRAMYSIEMQLKTCHTSSPGTGHCLGQNTPGSQLQIHRRACCECH